MKTKYITATCKECGAHWPLYYASPDITDEGIVNIWQKNGRSALVTSICPNNHQQLVMLFEDTEMLISDRPPSDFPKLERISANGD